MTTTAKTLSVLLATLWILPGCGDDAEDAARIYDIEPAGNLVEASFQAHLSRDELVDAYGSALAPYLDHGVSVYRVRYGSSDLDGSAIELSGAVVIPSMGNPVSQLSLQHYTVFHRDRAPSRFSDDSYLWDQPLAAASAGYLVSTADYLGFGDTDERVHPYIVANVTASASVDLLRAVRELVPQTDLELDGKLFLAGYSEGAYATVALQQRIEAEHADEFSITAAAAGAGSYDPLGTAELVFDNPAAPIGCPSCLAMVVYAYNDAYGWQRPMSDFFQQPHADFIAQGAMDGGLGLSDLQNDLPRVPEYLFTHTFIQAMSSGTATMMRDALDLNGVYRWAPVAPLRLLHSADDTWVPLLNSEQLYDHAVGHGSSSVDLIVLDAGDHNSAISDWEQDTLNWLGGF